MPLFYQNVSVLEPNKLLWERLSKKGEVPEGEWLNYTIIVMVEWIDQMIIEMYRQSPTFFL